MVRKRYAYDRERDRRYRSRRPKTPPPTQGWLIAELVKLTRVSARSIAHYVKVGLLHRAPFRGTATRYNREHLVRLLAIRRLRSQESLGLAEIKRRLGMLPAADLEALALGAASAEAAAALVTQGAPSNPRPAEAARPMESAPLPQVAVGASVAAGASVGLRGQHWVHVAMLPGLQVLVTPNAGATLLQLVDEIQLLCRLKAQSLGLGSLG